MGMFFPSYSILPFFLLTSHFVTMCLSDWLGLCSLWDKQAESKEHLFNTTSACQHKYRPEIEKTAYLIFRNQSRTANVLIDEGCMRSSKKQMIRDKRSKTECDLINCNTLT